MTPLQLAESCGAHITTDSDRPGAPSAGTMVVFRESTFNEFCQRIARRDWRKFAAAWLEGQAMEQEENNRKWPEHAAAYKSWQDRPAVLRMYAERVLTIPKETTE